MPAMKASPVNDSGYGCKKPPIIKNYLPVSISTVATGSCPLEDAYRWKRINAAQVPRPCADSPSARVMSIARRRQASARVESPQNAGHRSLSNPKAGALGKHDLLLRLWDNLVYQWACCPGGFYEDFPRTVGMDLGFGPRRRAVVRDVRPGPP